jgi:SAM-dependent methyltransferase
MQDDLDAHLDEWGLQRFTSDEAYFQWQRHVLSSSDIAALHAQVDKKRGGTSEDETAFYDLSAGPHILPVLYSQRYEYYRIIGRLVADRLAETLTILDFGCGPGILTTYYARRYPQARVIGLDRSAVCVAEAQRKAEALHLRNVRFECVDLDSHSLRGTYDGIVATHALVQSEQDPGLPSQRWNTFEREQDATAQSAFERRTGLGSRLDRLLAAMAPGGRVIIFEKTRQLARRIPLQRALAARGLRLLEQPQLIRYALVEEIADDGPFFVVQRGAAHAIAWNEQPEPDEGLPFDRARAQSAVRAADIPLYENHWPSAQQAWEQLRDKTVIREDTSEESDGCQLHVELGTTDGLRYLYCANTFDQRQLVIVDSARAEMLHTYYQEIIQGSA